MNKASFNKMMDDMKMFVMANASRNDTVHIEQKGDSFEVEVWLKDESLNPVSQRTFYFEDYDNKSG